MKTNFLSSENIFLFFENLAVNVEKYGTAGQATDDNMAHAH